MATYHVPVDGKMTAIEVPKGWQLISDEEAHRMRDAMTLLSDLDRCEHGRHAGDVCGGATGCDGPSHGNPYLTAGSRIGTSISARPITVPPRAQIWRADAWRSS